MKKLLTLLAISMSYACTSPQNLTLSFPVLTHTEIHSTQGNAKNHPEGEILKTRDKLCLGSPARTSKGTLPLVLQECNGQSHQLFSFYGEQIMSRGLCLDVAGHGVDKGTPVILYPCSGQDNQKWKFDGDYIRGEQSNKCLATENLIARKDAPVVLQDCSPARGLRFTQ